MKHQIAARLTLGGIAAVAALMTYATFEVVDLGKSIRYLVEKAKKPMQKITQQVTRADGQVVTIETTRIVDSQGNLEPVTEWRQRHDDAVQEFKNT